MMGTETVPAFIAGFFGLLWTVGVPLDIETLKVLAGWSAPVIAAVLTFLVAKWKLNNDSKSTDMANLITRMDKMQTRLDTLEKELREERSARAKDHSKIRELEDELRDSRELVIDLADCVVHTDMWIDAGAEPPHPRKTWRVKQYLKTHQLVRPDTDEQIVIEGT